MRVLITGGTGFIGRALTRAALERGWQVTVLTRKPGLPAPQRLAESGAALVIGDVTDRSSLRTAIEVAEPEVLYHNAGWYELGIARAQRRRMWQVNVEGVENTLGVAAECNVPKVVYTSSTTALGDTGGELADESFERRAPPQSFYERTKAEAHALALKHQAAGEPVIIACPAQAIGPGDHSPFGHFARLFLRGLLPFSWAPEGRFTFAHVEDIAGALCLIAERGELGEVYFIAGRELSTAEMVAAWGRTLGRKPPRIWLPRRLALGVAALTAPVLRLIGQSAFISPEVVRSSFSSFRYLSAKAERNLGVEFRSAEQAWEDTLKGEQDEKD
jgi:dihydroflavonol-4-reductase